MTTPRRPAREIVAAARAEFPAYAFRARDQNQGVAVG
jgi:hypothetical protein